MRHLFLDAAMLPAGWASNVRIGIDEGAIVSVETMASKTERDERVRGVAIPGMVNAHSHAFQRAFAGLAERRGAGEDSFWTWRDAMYRAAAQLTPDLMHAIAAQLYAEMLAAGYTSVVEFHYVHHQPDGRPYEDRSAMAQALIAAADEAGIGLTLLPVLYQTSGFGGRAARDDQKRFLNSVDQLLGIIEEARGATGPQLQVGLALHSLRAVPPEALRQAVGAVRDAPMHIHVAEQIAEVDDCLAWSGRRPVEWLLDEAPVDECWCLVHATHLTESETERLARSGATVALCPTTEANLGDGLCPVEAYLRSGGTFAIGSDSHVSVDPFEELRWLEYGQRLVTRRRSLVASADDPHSGAHMWRQSLSGGARACGRPIGAIAPGARADLIIVDPDHPALLTSAGDAMLDTLVFHSAARQSLRRVMCGGEWVVTEGRHVRAETFGEAYAKAVLPLRQALA
ncbi:formimidoylglutamate deiminase [Sphingomonas sp.]|jgi:formimidoylglutamate deiminase|uniref:formimidoylglutamate deiminase n=1 Tax=Sphingomonas sp. TaxID=28214 RepID=UPI002DEEE85A|nr:formimidoylglutamate deiminase [Sphingomonas sp.]HEV2568194.1 formimidoylglutamate deiminase [Sphingomonas sp.]